MLCKIERTFARWGASSFRVSGELRGDGVKILEELLLNVRHKAALDLKEVLSPAVLSRFLMGKSSLTIERLRALKSGSRVKPIGEFELNRLSESSPSS